MLGRPGPGVPAPRPTAKVLVDGEVLEWIERALALPALELLPLAPEIAAASTRLGPDWPGDPADRIIAATALHHGAILVTRDQRLRGRRELRTCW